ncbi:MAG: hypothetical protein LBD99_01310 [Candidatus Margulisbacteria bacterium]|jgi:hypothetical protein|nr:hypothetical protein [Candidatus Margulisiibacteriota bacterium]
MNIGKLSFSDIIKFGFDRRSISFTAKTLFSLFLVSGIFALLTSTLAAKVSAELVAAVEMLGYLSLLAISLILILGLYLFAKGSIAKTAKLNVWPAISALFWKELGALLIFTLSAAAIGIAAYWIGLLVKLPYAGNFLMALLFLPAAVFFALFGIYFIVGGKLLTAALVDKPRASAWQAVKTVWVISLKSPQKLAFNFVLSALPILITALTVFLAIGLLAVVPYLAFGWAFPYYPILNYVTQLGFAGTLGTIISCALNLLNSVSLLPAVLISLASSAILAYALAWPLNVAAVAYYSIYLDAK